MVENLIDALKNFTSVLKYPRHDFNANNNSIWEDTEDLGEKNGQKTFLEIKTLSEKPVIFCFF